MSMAHEGRRAFVMLSVALMPLSEDASKSGAPGAPGARLSIVMLRALADRVELPYTSVMRLYSV